MEKRKSRARKVNFSYMTFLAGDIYSGYFRQKQNLGFYLDTDPGKDLSSMLPTQN
jgi:hypothetical protein